VAHWLASRVGANRRERWTRRAFASPRTALEAINVGEGASEAAPRSRASDFPHPRHPKSLRQGSHPQACFRCAAESGEERQRSVTEKTQSRLATRKPAGLERRECRDARSTAGEQRSLAIMRGTHWQQHSVAGFFAGVGARGSAAELRSEKVDGDPGLIALVLRTAVLVRFPPMHRGAA